MEQTAVEKLDWFCPKCNSYVSSESVTFEENHQICNTGVILKELNKNNMEKEFVPYKLAVKLKKLGFDEPCFAGYRHSKWIGTDGPNSRYFHAQLFSNHQFDEDEQEYCSAPLFQQAFRWFREKGYDVRVQRESKDLYFGFYWTGIAWITIGDGTFEEAELACLIKLIEIVESKSE